MHATTLHATTTTEHCACEMRLLLGACQLAETARASENGNQAMEFLTIKLPDYRRTRLENANLLLSSRHLPFFDGADSSQLPHACGNGIHRSVSSPKLILRTAPKFESIGAQGQRYVTSNFTKTSYKQFSQPRSKQNLATLMLLTHR